MRLAILIIFLTNIFFAQNSYYEEVITPNDGGYFTQFFGQNISTNGTDYLISSNNGIYFYHFTDSNWVNYQTIEKPEGAIGFGRFTQLIANTAYVSAHSEGVGKIYIFTKTENTWTNTGFITTTDIDVQKFGNGFDVSGNTAIIRAVSLEGPDEFSIAYLYQHDGDNWIFHSRLDGQDEGFCIGLEISGNSILIGEPTFFNEELNSTGAVHYYQLDEYNSLNEINLITPNQAIENSRFGQRIILENQKLYISAPGNNISSNHAGLIYEFEFLDTTCIETNIISPEDGENGDWFGLIFNIDDNTMVATSYNNSDGGFASGKSYIFKYDEEINQWFQFKTIFPSDLSPGDWFGSFATLNNDFAFISSPFRNNWEGAVYIYDPHDNSLHSNFVADVRNGEGPVTVQFTSGAQGNPTAWEWDFNNDGTIDSVEEHPQFTYQINGIYSVRLTVYDDEIGDSALKENYIQVTSDVIYGDLDSSGSLDVNDLVIFVAIILGDLEPDDSQLLAGDVNYSGEIDILDVVIAVDVILGM